MIPHEQTSLVSGSSGTKKKSRENYGSTSKFISMAETPSTLSSESRTFPRIVEAKHARQVEPGEPVAGYLRVSNSIRTTKYSILTFLPKNLFEQFHRVANIYFLVLVILNFIPVLNAIQPYLSLLPLLFVLTVTALKDIYEDHRRYVNDKAVNSRICSVYDSSTNSFEGKHWRDVQVGDLVEISNNGIFPADLLLVDSSDHTSHLCYVETSNLDGETNLKQRSVPKSLCLAEGVEFDPSNYRCRVHCENAHHQIYKFNGYLELKEGGPSVPLTKDNLLLRGCALRNTRRVFGIVVYTGHETKALLNNSGPPSKRSKLERSINREIVILILMLVCLCTFGAVGNRIWTGSRGYRDILFLPGEDLSLDRDAFYLFLTFVIVYQVLVPISLYVSVEVVKLWQVIFLNWDIQFYWARNDKRLVCRALNLNEDLGQIEYVFSDKTGTLTENEMIFRRCNINGLEYPHSPDISPTRTSPPPLSPRTRRGLGPQSESSIPADYKLSNRLKSQPSGCIEEEFMLVLALCNTVVTSRRSTDKGSVQNGQAAASTTLSDGPVVEKLVYEAESPDELALVLAAQTYGYVLQSRTINTVTVKFPNDDLVIFDVLNILQFDATRKRMSVIVRRQGTDEIKLLTKGADSAIYSSFGDATGSGYFGVPSPCPEDSLCSSPHIQETRADATQRFLDMYARQGLRTLGMASRILSEDEYGAWLQEHDEAECAATNREELVRLSACRIEQQLELLGSTGIEDRLQDHVAETIAGLRAAGIHVWVLTGDKQETAVNVAYSCQLIDEDMEVIIMNATKRDACEEQLTARLQELHLQRVHEKEHDDRRPSLLQPAMKFIFPGTVERRQLRPQAHSAPSRPRALVVSGVTLQFLLSDSMRLDFLQLAAQCRSVICCRSTPLQKANVVGLVRHGLGVMSLAVGDGANDVSMIQMANLGVGIAGVEGQQAVMASDVAICRFHHLHRLLLVHGHWCYDRIARMMLYFYYKNAVFVFLIFWYQLFNGFSASIQVDDLYLLLYNLVFTSVPPVITAIVDQNLPPDVLLANPQLYCNSQQDKVYNLKHFWLTMLDATWQGFALFFTAYLAYYDSDVGMLELGTTQNTACILTVSIHLFIETQYWTIFHHLALWGSLVVYLATGLIYNIIPTVEPHFVMEHTIGTVEFWAVVFLSTFIALLPRLFFKSLRNSFFPDPVLVAQAQEARKRSC